jgi:hypothetical protein
LHATCSLSRRARNDAFPIKILNFFTASPATLAALGTGLAAVSGIMLNEINSSKCTLFQSDVTKCNGTRKF